MHPADMSYTKFDRRILVLKSFWFHLESSKLFPFRVRGGWLVLPSTNTEAESSPEYTEIIYRYLIETVQRLLNR